MRGPDDSHRTIVLGRTGSGKSQFAIHLLSSRSFHTKPWVTIDYKREDLLEEIREDNRDKIKVIGVDEKPPKKPGLYIVRPAPKADDDAIERFMLRMWEKEDIGLFVDEGFALPQQDAFDRILTQGRSKNIPVIALYQRPVWMSRFAVAQADFFAAFHINDERDRKVMRQYITGRVQNNGEVIDINTRLPDYHCLWYDVGRDAATVLAPAPGRAEILQTYRARLGSRKGRFV